MLRRAKERPCQPRAQISSSPISKAPRQRGRISRSCCEEQQQFSSPNHPNDLFLRSLRLRVRPNCWLEFDSGRTPKRSQSLFNFFFYCYAVPLESLRVDQNAVLLILFQHIHQCERPDSISVGNLTKVVSDWSS